MCICVYMNLQHTETHKDCVYVSKLTRYVYIYIDLYTNTYVYTCIYIYMYIYMYMRIYIYIYLYIYIFLYIFIYVYMCISHKVCVYMYVYIYNIQSLSKKISGLEGENLEICRFHFGTLCLALSLKFADSN